MNKKLAMTTLVAALIMPTMVPAPASARSGYYDSHHVWHGKGGHYRYRCKRSSGTTGAIAGGVGGAVIGNALGGGLLGTVAGGAGGALLGKHLDKKHDAAQNRRNGC